MSVVKRLLLLYHVCFIVKYTDCTVVGVLRNMRKQPKGPKLIEALDNP